MLVIPVTKGNKKKFPIVTFSLILLNCFIFFFLQANDRTSYYQASSYYVSSGLAKIEFVEYKVYLAANKTTISPGYEITSNTPPTDRQIMMMDEDGAFQRHLQTGQLLASPPIQEEWRKKRPIFEEKLSHVYSHRYGYSPVRQNYLGLFTCMFLHGGISHLAGNMLFLWFVGAILEVGVGWKLFLPGYLFTGTCASLLFGLVYPMEVGPLIGASGAIAGLMGAYGLVFGKTRIKVFYSLGFYFDYATIYGWLLFPFWLLNEFYQLYTNPGSNVAYMAHIGGLISGGLLGALHMKFHGNKTSQEFQEIEEKNRIPLLLEEGLNSFAELRLQEARAKMLEVLTLDPENRLALKHLFTIDKCKPESEDFHKTASQLLNCLARDEQADEELLLFYEKYRKLSSKPRLNADVIAAMIFVYIKHERQQDSSALTNILLKQLPGHRRLPKALWELGSAYKTSGNQTECQKCLKILASDYVDTSWGTRAANILVDSI